MRLFLAFACFFRVLFGRRLPQDFPVELLPEPPEKPDVQKLIAEATAKPKPEEIDPSMKAKTAPAVQTSVAQVADVAAKAADRGALMVLGILQREGRLVDFVRESIDGYDDAAVGAAVRDIHKGCKKAIDEHFDLDRVMAGAENAKVSVEKDFDANRIRLVGAVKGQPPFQGTLRHHGWTVTKVKLPRPTSGVDYRVIAPAEVEL